MYLKETLVGFIVGLIFYHVLKFFIYYSFIRQMRGFADKLRQKDGHDLATAVDNVIDSCNFWI